MDNLYIKCYDNLKSCPEELLAYLRKYEVQNTFILIEIQKSIADCTFIVLLNKKTNAFVFGLLVTRGMVYVSKIFIFAEDDECCKQLVDYLVKEFLSKSLPVDGIHGYEPELSIVLTSFNKHSALKFGLTDNAWSYVIEKVEWSARSLEIKDDPNTLLYQATSDDLDWITEWTQEFINDDAGELVENPRLRQLCQEEIEGNNVYILFVNGVAVSMARKRRPMQEGCTLAMVYTPLEHRRKGYGGACVSMVTNKLLKDFKYVTLFVDPKQNPNNNMYTRIGYKLLTKAGRSYRA